MSRERGFVLVNALIIVAALSAAAVFLLTRAEGGRVRLDAAQTSGQLGHYLDAFEALAITVLDADTRGGTVDHPGEDWARSDYDVAVDRGRISGGIEDMQGVFNLNWLADPTNQAARDAFGPLLLRSGVSPQIGDAILDFMRPGGPENRQAYAARHPAIDPVGGALLMFDQLRDIPGVSEQDLARLAGYFTVLPGDSKLNVNIAAQDLLGVLLPEVRPGTLFQVLARRQRTPFNSVDEFMAALEAAHGESLEGVANAARFSVGSDWFRVNTRAELRGRTAVRTTVMRRFASGAGTIIHWRVTTFD